MILILKSKNTNLSKMEYEAKYTSSKKMKRKRLISAITLLAVTSSMFGGICSVIPTAEVANIPDDTATADSADSAETVDPIDDDIVTDSGEVSEVEVLSADDEYDDTVSITLDSALIPLAARYVQENCTLYSDYVNESSDASEEVLEFLDSKVQATALSALSSSDSASDSDAKTVTTKAASASLSTAEVTTSKAVSKSNETSKSTSKDSDSSDTATYEYFKDYIPVITLDYDWEQIDFPYAYQKYLWRECQKYDNIDYYLMLGVIARESRFEEDPENYLGMPYYGFFGVGQECAEDVSERLGLDYVLDIHDPYDNITIGVAFTSYCIEETGSEYAGLWAYGTGISGYYAAIKSGETHSSDVDKAYKFKKLLEDKDLNPTKTVKIRKS
jgi:hypothetical protein